ncbi:MAG: hypothetical protein IID45_02205 [Planctomycetes bacterium]|nr:hypothetical protein [Planctomycetota bacterium]
MKKHLLSILGLFFLAYFASIPVSPADPVTMIMIMAAIFPVALFAYWLGVRNGRTLQIKALNRQPVPRNTLPS